MKKLNGLSLAAQQISVKGGTRAPSYLYFNTHYLSRVLLNAHKVPPLGLCVGLAVLFVTCSTLSALLRNTGCISTRDFLFGLLCSPVAAALMKCVVSNTLVYTVEFTKMPLQMQLVLGVEGRIYKTQWQVFFFVNFGQNRAPHFTVVLHSNVFNGK